MHSSGAFDLDAFDLEATLKRLDGDRGLLRELIGFFFEDSPMIVAQLKAAVRDANLSAIERAAHSLKGLTANVGSGSASRVAGRIEESARQNDLGTAAATFEELARELARLNAALKQFQATPDPPGGAGNTC
jgi:HPt (histidine-containing phosphotransfer) domain-containing protein